MPPDAKRPLIDHRIYTIRLRRMNEFLEVFDRLVTTQKGDFFFRERSRRPPTDNLNALLSFVYTLLAHDCVGALESVGLDPQVGFLHRERPGRPSLSPAPGRRARAV